MYMYNLITVWYSRNYHNIVNQPYFNKTLSNRKKELTPFCVNLLLALRKAMKVYQRCSLFLRSLVSGTRKCQLSNINYNIR